MKLIRKVFLISMLLIPILVISCRKPTAPIHESPYILWERTNGKELDDEACSVQETSDRGYIIAGYTTLGYRNADVYLIKVSKYGQLLWEKTYGGMSDDKGISVYETSDSGFIVTGYTASFGPGSYNVYLIKTDKNGDTLWTKAFGAVGYDEGKSVLQTIDGGYIIAGFTEFFGSGNSDIYLIKTDEDGNLLWEKTYGGSNRDKGMSIQQTLDGGYIIAGITDSFPAFNTDICLIKTDENGDILWERIYGREYFDWCHTVQLTSDGGYIISGLTCLDSSDIGDVWLLKTDKNGDTLWTKTYGGLDKEDGYSVQQTFDGGFLIGGYTSYYCYLIKTDQLGDTLWTEILKPGMIKSIQKTSDYAYIAVGWTSGKNKDVYIVKIR
ncbi:hypothetical protein KAW96_10515 [candidate division WOR-3 bacterium]|nr:hypothetical protein [candidate division WOR-3 bacterium]